MRPLFPALLLVMMSACSSPAPEAKLEKAAAPPAHAAPPDESQRFPQTGLVKMVMTPDHLLGKSFMPGGNLAFYKAGKTEYQQFLGQMPDSDRAAFLLLDWKRALQKAKYLPQFGGYFGMDGTEPVFVFVKGKWVAGTVGLPEAKADLLARQFAAHL